MNDFATPGWYPDPEDAKRIRYWDGQKWTENLLEHPNPPKKIWLWILASIVLALICGYAALQITSSSNDPDPVVIKEDLKSSSNPLPQTKAKVEPFLKSILLNPTSLDNYSWQEISDRKEISSDGLYYIPSQGVVYYQVEGSLWELKKQKINQLK